jgi:hypothetical protein
MEGKSTVDHKMTCTINNSSASNSINVVTKPFFHGLVVCAVRDVLFTFLDFFYLRFLVWLSIGEIFVFRVYKYTNVI